MARIGTWRMTVWALAIISGSTRAIGNDDCYCLPQDSCWPAPDEWAALNATVGGRLVVTVPLGSVCHEPTYDKGACQALRDGWRQSVVHYESSASMMQTYWMNQSCNPFAAAATPCTLGNMVAYAVNVTGTDDVAATVRFARQHNVRLIVRNTGHDHGGRSGGAGALAVWTHHLKDMEVVSDYAMDDGAGRAYRGAAMRLGAGVQGIEATAYAGARGLVVVGGWCPSVGIAGGFTQGGGHSPLGSVFGMGADQALEFEAVTVEGDVVTASPRENPDLYWALAGGGPGTYAVVTRLTVRAHASRPVAGAFVTIQNDLVAANASAVLENYWATLGTFWGLLPNLTAAGVGATFSYNNSLFYLIPLTAYDKTADEVRALLRPWTRHMDALGVAYTAQFTDSPDYHTHWRAFVPDTSPVGGYWQAASRIVPAAALAAPANLTAFLAAARRLADAGVFAGVTAVAPRGPAAGGGGGAAFANAVLPAWRGAAALFGLLTEWSDAPAAWAAQRAGQARAAAELRPALFAATGGPAGPGPGPGVGSYVNEAAAPDPNWRAEFYGPNWARLAAVKARWDPDARLWGMHLVGSEARAIAGSPAFIGDGRLCRVRSEG